MQTNLRSVASRSVFGNKSMWWSHHSEVMSPECTVGSMCSGTCVMLLVPYGSCLTAIEWRLAVEWLPYSVVYEGMSGALALLSRNDEGIHPQ